MKSYERDQNHQLTSDGMIDKTTQLLDRKGALDRIGDDAELYEEIADLFVKDTPVQISALESAIENDDRPLIERQSHSLKSAAANVGAERMRAVCATLEQRSMHAPSDELKRLARVVQDEFRSVEAALRGGS